jgi:hypothetical protein
VKIQVGKIGVRFGNPRSFHINPEFDRLGSVSGPLGGWRPGHLLVPKVFPSSALEFDFRFIHHERSERDLCHARSPALAAIQIAELSIGSTYTRSLIPDPHNLTVCPCEGEMD